MKKPKLKNFVFKKGIKSYLNHLKKYSKQGQLKKAQEIINKEHNVLQNCDITPKFREHPKVIKVKDDGTIIYKIKRNYFKKKTN